MYTGIKVFYLYISTTRKKFLPAFVFWAFKKAPVLATQRFLKT